MNGWVHFNPSGRFFLPWRQAERSGGGASRAVSVDADAGGGEEEVQDILAEWSVTSAN